VRRFSVSIALPAVVCVCLILSRSELTAQNTGPAFHWRQANPGEQQYQVAGWREYRHDGIEE